MLEEKRLTATWHVSATLSGIIGSEQGPAAALPSVPVATCPANTKLLSFLLADVLEALLH